MQHTKGWGAYCHRNERVLIEKGGIMQCPKCNGEMWDNRAKKQSGEFKESSPDYACRDKACHEGIWLKDLKEKPEVIKEPPKTNGTSTEMMRLAYRKDLMCSIVNTFAPQGVLHTAMPDIFTILWDRVEKDK